jgi:hypothetical protein
MPANIAIVATEGSLYVEVLLSAIAESALALSRISLVTPLAASKESDIVYAGEKLNFVDITGFDFEQIQCAIVLTPAIMIEAYKDQLSKAGTILGFMDGLSSLNPVLFDERCLNVPKVVGVLQAPVAVLQYVLSGLSCESINAVVFYPASFYESQGVNELAAQSTKLLNMQPVESRVFEERLPFNYYPMSANVEGAELEQQLKGEIEAVFLAEVSVVAVQMPVFYGISMVLTVSFEDEVNLQSVQNEWAAKKFVAFQELDSGLSNAYSLESDGIINIGKVTPSSSDPYRLDFWISVDDIKFSVHHSLISTAEFLLKHDL